MLTLSIFVFWLLNTIDMFEFMHVMEHMLSVVALLRNQIIIITCKFSYVSRYYFVNCSFCQISPMVDNYGSFDFTPLKYVCKYYGSFCWIYLKAYTIVGNILQLNAFLVLWQTIFTMEAWSERRQQEKTYETSASPNRCSTFWSCQDSWGDTWSD